MSTPPSWPAFWSIAGRSDHPADPHTREDVIPARPTSERSTDALARNRRRVWSGCALSGHAMVNETSHMYDS